MRLRNLILTFAAALAVMTAADSPFIGKWKLNPAKSQFAGNTMIIEQLPSGEMQITAEGQTFKFKADGKEYPGPFGTTATWKQIDANNWENVTKMGTMVTTGTSKISADGKTMTTVDKGKKPNGEDFLESSTWQRVSGGPGILGTWKSTKVQTTTENWEISANGDDGLTFKIADYNAVCSLKFDSKDYPCTGPTMPKGFMMSAKKTGARSIEITDKMDGKVIFNDMFSVAADGKTMTDEGTAAGTKEKVTVVYDKQ